MADPLARVAALLARAADAGSSEEEARTAAVQAARLMRAHGLRVVAADGRASGERPTVVTPDRVDRAIDIAEDLVDVGAGFLEELRRAARGAPPRRRRVGPRR